MKKIIACIAVAAAVLSGCSKEDNTNVTTVDEKGVLEFTAVVPETRTYLGGSHADYTEDKAERAVLWSAGDKLTIWSDVNAPLTYALTKGANTTKGTFNYTPTNTAPYGITGKEIYAIYPYSPKTTVSGNEAYIELPNVQVCSQEANFDQNYNPMAAFAKDNVSTLQFKNLCSIIVIKVTPDDDLKISKIVLDTESTPLCGPATVSLGETISMKLTDASQTTLTLNTNNVAVEEKKEYIFYAVVPAGNYTDLGIKIFTQARGEYALYKVRTKAMNLKAGEVTAIGATFNLNTDKVHVYQIGEQYPYGVAAADVKGIVFATNADGTEGKILAINDSSAASKWGPATKTPVMGSTTDGAANMAVAVANTITNYPAFNACYTIDAQHNWYLPARGGLKAIMDNYKALEQTWRNITNKNGATDYMLPADEYWTSSMGGGARTTTVYYFDVTVAIANAEKEVDVTTIADVTKAVRAVAKFPLKK